MVRHDVVLVLHSSSRYHFTGVLVMLYELCVATLQAKVVLHNFLIPSYHATVLP